VIFRMPQFATEKIKARPRGSGCVPGMEVFTDGRSRDLPNQSTSLGEGARSYTVPCGRTAMRSNEVIDASSQYACRSSRRVRKGLALLSAGVVFFCVFLARGHASAAEYYVSPTGSDSNPGTQASPFATVQKANTPPRAGIPSGCAREPTPAQARSRLSKSEPRTPNRTKDLGVFGRGAYSRFLELLIGQLGVGQSSHHCDRELDAAEALDATALARAESSPIALFHGRTRFFLGPR